MRAARTREPKPGRQAVSAEMRRRRAGEPTSMEARLPLPGAMPRSSSGIGHAWENVALAVSKTRSFVITPLPRSMVYTALGLT